MLRHPLVIVVLVLVGLAVVFQLVISLAPERFYVREQPSEMAVAWRADEALIFVPLQRTGRRTSVIIEKFGSWMPDMMRVGMDMPTWLPSNSRVFHLAGGQLTPFELKGMGAYGHFAISEGMPALVKCGSCEEKPVGYRWDGTAMVPLEPAEAARIDRHDARRDEDPISLLQEQKEEFAAAGWSFDRMPLWGARDRKLKFALGGGAHTLQFTGPGISDDDSGDVYEWAGRSGPMSLTLRGPDGADRALLSLAGEWQRQTQEEFFAQVPPETRDNMSRMRPMMLGPMAIFGWLFSSLFRLVWFLPCLLPMWWMLGYRGRTLKTLPDTYDFQPTSPAEFAKLDRAQLDQRSGELEALGFRALRDISVVPDAGKFEPDFSRLFVHPEHGCFAQVVQHFPHRGKPRPMAVVFHSLLANDWSLSTSAMHTPALTYRARLPQSLWFCVPGAAPAQLLEAHLERRSRVCNELGTSVYRDLNFAAYQSYALGRYAERRQALRKRGLLFGPREAFILRLRPPLEWLGELPSRRAA